MSVVAVVLILALTSGRSSFFHDEWLFIRERSFFGELEAVPPALAHASLLWVTSQDSPGAPNTLRVKNPTLENPEA